MDREWIGGEEKYSEWRNNIGRPLCHSRRKKISSPSSSSSTNTIKQPPPPDSSLSSAMNRSPSEWAFQRFLEEVVAETSYTTSPPPSETTAPVDLPSNPTVDPDSKLLRSDGGGLANNDVIEIKDRQSHENMKIAVDSEEYQAFLRSRLDLACAAVARSRASFGKPQEAVTLADHGPQASATSQLGSQAPPKDDAANLVADVLEVDIGLLYCSMVGAQAISLT
ncbi:hypothetical protein RJ641_020535 [Dillenia turbinata]|uniref:Uncharacterized protein n=1 Tax=Dillenia turbinata TaxID=194707 RepID=A0AAN8UT16_9MAGN